MFWKKSNMETGTERKLSRAEHSAECDRLSEANRQAAAAEAAEYEAAYQEALDGARQEDARLREEARAGDLPVAPISYANGVFLSLGEGKELPVAFIEEIEVHAPTGGDLASYIVCRSPRVESSFVGSTRSYYSLEPRGDHYYAWQGHAYVAMATRPLWRTSGSKDRIEIDPYACEAIYERACEIWKDGE